MEGKRSNPDVVNLLIDAIEGTIELEENEMNEWYMSLNKGDKAKVVKAAKAFAEQDDEDEVDACAACGNPAYPKCMSSCNLYDD